MPYIHVAQLYGGEALYLPGAAFGPRDLRNWEMVWILAGNVTYHADGLAFDAPPGTIILARPGFHERYVWDPAATSRHVFFHFELRKVPDNWPDLKYWPIARTFTGNDPLRPLFRYMVDHILPRIVDREPTPHACRVIETMLSIWLDRADPAGADEHLRFSEPVERALQWAESTLSSNGETPIALDDLAVSASVSSKHLCRLFSAELGFSPMRAVHAMRLERAMMLVARSNLTIQQIATQSGFASPYHFSRSFSKLFGRSPTSVRKTIARGDSPPVARLPWRTDRSR